MKIYECMNVDNNIAEWMVNKLENMNPMEKYEIEIIVLSFVSSFWLLNCVRWIDGWMNDSFWTRNKTAVFGHIFVHLQYKSCDDCTVK